MGGRRLLRRPLTIREILAWASAHRETAGKWPTKSSGGIVGTRFETWLGVDGALREGFRGLPGGSSLARLLLKAKGARNVQNLPQLTESGILQWADEHHERTGLWPTSKSGAIPDSGGDKWQVIDMALRRGLRSLPGGSSLAQFLARHRGVRNRKRLPPLNQEKILEWADAHYRRTAKWPIRTSGPIADAPGETWLAVAMALSHGIRGLPGGTSLAHLLAQRRGVRNRRSITSLSIAQILVWADAFHKHTGRWPHPASGLIPNSEGTTWCAVNHALHRGTRGLIGGLSLAELLVRERGARNQRGVPPLSLKQILGWVDAYRRREGRWPRMVSGSIPEAPNETWYAVDAALRQGCRGLRGDSSLARLLAKNRRRRNHLGQPPLSFKRIVAWADAHFHRTDMWPNVNSGSVKEAPGERWDVIDNALRQGHRGLAGGSSLVQLLGRKRGVRNPQRLPPLTEEQILGWAKGHYRQEGRWPVYKSGSIKDAPGETWAGVDSALRYGKRGLPGGSSLAKLLTSTRGT